MNTKSKEERLEIVLALIKKLRNFPTVNSTTIDLYNSEYPSMRKLREIFSRYVNQPEFSLSGETGTIPFPEMNRKIEYLLPIKKSAEPKFVLRYIN
jgi:hypothetical protein